MYACMYIHEICMKAAYEYALAHTHKLMILLHTCIPSLRASTNKNVTRTTETLCMQYIF